MTTNTPEKNIADKWWFAMTAVSLPELAAAWRANQSRTGELHTQLRTAVCEAVAAGMSESEAARQVGVTRMTIRAWLGK